MHRHPLNIRRRRQRGVSIIEASLLLPWFIFLFVGAYDWGFYAHALISIESAARVAALNSANAGGGNVSATTACNLVLDELKIAANTTNVTTCSALPVIVTPTCTTTAGLNAVQVAVTYRSLQLVPIPGLLQGQATLYRTVQMPMKNNNTCTIGS
jgi:hypothetical protein